MNIPVCDLVIAALLLFFLWQGYRKGFVLTLCGLLALFVAFIGATVISGVLAEPVSRTLAPMVEQHLQQLFEEYVSAAPQLAGLPLTQLPLGDLSAELPKLEIPLSELLEAIRTSPLYGAFADSVREAVDSGVLSASADAARMVAEFIARQLARTVLFVISFVVILILWFFLSHALDLAFRLPVLSTLNRLSGALLGLAEGSILVWAACLLLNERYVDPDMVEQSYLLKIFCTTTLKDVLSFISLL